MCTSLAAGHVTNTYQGFQGSYQQLTDMQYMHTSQLHQTAVVPMQIRYNQAVHDLHYVQKNLDTN